MHRATSEKRVKVLAKNSVVRSCQIMSSKGEWVEERSSSLQARSVVELNRTEVKAPFKGYVEMNRKAWQLT